MGFDDSRRYAKKVLALVRGSDLCGLVVAADSGPDRALVVILTGRASGEQSRITKSI